MLYFITSSQHKFDEISAVVPGLERLDMDLPEIQEIDAKLVVRAKLMEAVAHHEGEFIVEDTSLYLDCLNGLPGPLIKWFMKTIGRDGLWQIADKFGIYGAEARTTIGYACGHEEVYFFEGVRRGRIVAPRGESNFGWDPIFEPEGLGKTQAELTREEKNAVSMRGEAARKLKDFLDGGAIQ
jgi:non-canonical purine NTP pyrophosphatase (RdgB/HAM1 family)